MRGAAPSVVVVFDDDPVAFLCPGDERVSTLQCQDDAYQLTRAGLAGGKGVPDTVAAHPPVFVTLTAPSFGLVHSRALGRDGRVVPYRALRSARRGLRA